MVVAVVIARGGRPEIYEPIEETLDGIALPVKLADEGWRIDTAEAWPEYLPPAAPRTRPRHPGHRRLGSTAREASDRSGQLRRWPLCGLLSDSKNPFRDILVTELRERCETVVTERS